MDNYIIRNIQEGDAASFAYIQTQSWKVAFKGIISDEALERATNLEKATNMYQKLIDEKIGNGYLLLVDEKPHCIAFWDKSRNDDMDGYAELICIHSLQDRWRCGYGSKMMDQVLYDIEKAGYKKVMLWVFEKNTRARAFYEAKGFTLTSKTQTGFNEIEVCYVKNI